MKTLAYYLLVFAILITGACKKGDDGPSNVLSGRWNLVASYISMGPPGSWVPVNKSDNKYVQFNNDGKLYGNVYSEYATYKLKDSVTIVFSKTDNTIQNYRYMIRKDTLILSPAGPIFCIEGCGLKFAR